MRIIICLALCATACNSFQFQRVAGLTIVSTRNVDMSQNYTLLAGNTEVVVDRGGEQALQTAIEQLMAKHPGAVYVMNATVYADASCRDCIKVVGDVWGIAAAATEPPKAAEPLKPGQRALWTKRTTSGKALTQPKPVTVVATTPTSAIIERTNAQGKAVQSTVPLSELEAID